MNDNVGNMISENIKPIRSDSEKINAIRNKEYKILVIDDDDGFRKSFCFKLKRKYKAQVDDVDSGKAGIEKLSDGNTYDFIFTDIMMPGMTGIEAYHELREIDGKIPIIIMSAYSDSNEWKEAQEVDVPLLHKPISDDQLIKILGA
jgi:two-component system nitrogen regulation response regulator GlnG